MPSAAGTGEGAVEVMNCLLEPQLNTARSTVGVYLSSAALPMLGNSIAGIFWSWLVLELLKPRTVCRMLLVGR